MESRRDQRPATAERQPGKSSLGVSRQFSEYFGTDPQDPTAGRIRDGSGDGSRLGVGEMFKQEADSYRPHIKVIPRSRFGLPGRQMADVFQGSKGENHTAFVAQMESFRKAESDERFNALWNGASMEQNDADE
jgi:hypothetical protein